MREVLLDHIDREAQGWNKAWSSKGVYSWYPDEQVVRFLAANFVKRYGVAGKELSHRDPCVTLQGLDLGCGNGRHIITMQEMGIDAFGVDLSEVAIASANDWLADKHYPSNATVGSLTDLSYEDDRFDLGICHGVLDHMLPEIRSASLNEIKRVMKPGALLLLSLISENDSAYGSGQELDHMTWAVEDGFERGLPQAFFTIDMVEKHLEHFKIISIVEVKNQSIFGRSLIGTDKHYSCDARYYVTAKCR